MSVESNISPIKSGKPKPPQIITMKDGIKLLEKLSLVEWSVQAAMTGDNGPLTSSPNQRRSMALVMADIAGTLTALATKIDPLAERGSVVPMPASNKS